MPESKTVVGMFDSREAAERGVSALLAQAYRREEIGMVVGDARTITETPAVGPIHSVGADTEAGRDAAIGGMAGFVAGLVALAIPGIGPLLAVGPLAGALAGAGVGAATGGLIGALKDYGVSEQEAEYYQEGLRRGGAIVTVTADEDRADAAAQALKDAGAADILKRAEEWRAEGWTPRERVRHA
jgi:uncharacterized membrane protein